MALVLAGIDEAGYGPTLGPLCVGLAAFRVGDGNIERAPDLWELLSSGVCREPGRGGAHDKMGRVAVADSKKIKLSNSVRSTHPLIHLERGVLAFAGVAFPGWREGMTDATLFDALGVASAWHRCYDAPARALPLGTTAGELAIATSLLGGALERAGVTPVALRCDVTPEPLFNACVRETSNKAETVIAALGRHLREVWALAGPGDRIAIACDRLGGRAHYAMLLESALPGVRVEPVEEAETRSRYVLSGGDGRRGGIAFLTGGEDAHLPVALASMTAKLTRELLMGRFNAFWSQAYQELEGRPLRPTAGYALDARRWLDEVGQVMPAEDRRTLVRIA